MNLRHTAFSWKQWCCSAKAKVVATVFMATFSQSFASESNLSLSRPYLSAAASRCCAIRVEAHFEFTPASSSKSGRSSQYMKCRKACKLISQKERKILYYKPSSLEMVIQSNRINVHPTKIHLAPTFWLSLAHGNVITLQLFYWIVS